MLWTESPPQQIQHKVRFFRLQTPVSLPANEDQTLTYKIKDLLPFTVYRAAVACRAESGIWSDWSSDVTARTLDRGNCLNAEIKLKAGDRSNKKYLGDEGLLRG